VEKSREIERGREKSNEYNGEETRTQLRKGKDQV